MNEKLETITITIDGPAGAGKSTVSKKLAAKLGYVYVDTGALYRGVAYEVKKRNIDYKNESDLAGLLNILRFDCKTEKNDFRLISNGKDISEKIRTSEISMLASAVSALPLVRSALLDIQKNIAKQYNAVFEGRDMGTVVFPDAEFKFFLTADLDVRAKRRYMEKSLDQTRDSDDFKNIKADMKKRDYDDSNRCDSPLKPAEDAILIDSTGLNIDQVVEKIYENLIIS